ncbi:PrsW family intramembrane metalloprotease [Candidatus Peregrinibacteria bacterium]|nr:PrsW family intramembrane metalloprotease [Candidatus Peregrinibacteria bacterium]
MSVLLQIFGSILLAFVPVVIWGTIFYRKNPRDKKLIALTFIVGALAVFPILLYKISWQFLPWLNAFRVADIYKDDIIGFTNLIVLPLSVVITFMIVGLIEEIMKLLSVKIIDDDEILSVDDAIEFFIVAALGFSFTENILYFYNIWLAEGPYNLLLPFLFRSAFSTFAHLLFSGILGYYYGVAHFARPILQRELREKRKHWTVLLHKLFNLRKEKLFHQEKLLEGLIISIGLHAIFNIFLEMNLSFMMGPFLMGGYLALNYLFAMKENHKNYAKLLQGYKNSSTLNSLNKYKNRI